MTKLYRKECWALFTWARPWDWAPRPVVLDVEYRCARDCDGYAPKDEDNARAACKALVDGMRDARIVPDDSKRYVRWGEFRLLTARAEYPGREPGITVTVRAA